MPSSENRVFPIFGRDAQSKNLSAQCAFAPSAKGGIGSDGTPHGGDEFNFRAAIPNAKAVSYAFSHGCKSRRMRTYAKRGEGDGAARRSTFRAF